MHSHCTAINHSSGDNFENSGRSTETKTVGWKKRLLKCISFDVGGNLKSRKLLAGRQVKVKMESENGK